MQLICTDGTTIPCDDFEAIDSGVLFFRERSATGSQADEESEESEDDAETRASGFVPMSVLQFVLPDTMVQQQAAGQRRVPNQTPPGPGAQQPEGMAQQQQLYQTPGSR